MNRNCPKCNQKMADASMLGWICVNPKCEECPKYLFKAYLTPEAQRELSGIIFDIRGQT